MKIIGQQFFFTFLTVSLIIILDNGVSSTSYAAWPFRSSDQNRKIAEQEYKNSPMERYVATAVGDEIPYMRDDIIRRKNNGEGFWERHLYAWTTLSNWRYDYNNDWKEMNN